MGCPAEQRELVDCQGATGLRLENIDRYEHMNFLNNLSTPRGRASEDGNDDELDRRYGPHHQASTEAAIADQPIGWCED